MNPLCRRRVFRSCWRDGSGPLETSIGVFIKPLDMMMDFWQRTRERPWPWANEFVLRRNRVGCGSHIHFRPAFDDIRDRLGLSPEVAWSVIWNTLIDLSLILFPLLVLSPHPRRSFYRWAEPWPFGGDSDIPHRWGRRSEETFRRYVVACEFGEPDCVNPRIINIKHIDSYKFVSLSGTHSDVGSKPVTAEVRAAETHPLFAATFVRVIIRYSRIALERGLSPKLTEDSRRTIYAALERIADGANVYDVWRETGPIRFEPDRSPWPNDVALARGWYEFDSLMSAFRTIVMDTVAEKGTPYYRAARFIVVGCDLHREIEETSGRSLWDAIARPRGEFRWATCDVDTG